MGIFNNKFIQRQQEARLMRKKEKSIYEAIKEQPDLAAKSKKLATRSIVFSCLSILMVILGVGGLFLIFNLIEPKSIFTTITICFLLGGLLIYLFFLFFIKSFICLNYQFKLNKTPITWVALAFIILPALVLVVVIVSLVLGKLQGN